MADDKEQRTIEIILKAQDANASLKEMAAGAAVMTAQLSRMGKDDPGRAALLADLQLLNGRLGTQRTEMRGTAKSAEELAAAEAKLAAQQIKVVVDGQKVSATFNEMKAAATQLEKELGDLSKDAPGRAKMIADYQALQGRIAAVKTEMGEAAPKASFFKQALGFAGITLGVEAVVSGIVETGKAVFEATAKFEKYEAVMTTALGDKGKAQQAMKDIQKMAASTPFSVDELTGSFIKFVNRGLNPSMTEMGKLADLAASQGKSFDQLTEAVLDAGGGEFERLKEFGLKASKSGDQVTLSFKGVNQVVKNTPEAINGAIMAFGSMQGVAGSTAAISKTLEGQLSNLGDQADMLKTRLGDGLKPMFTLVMTLFSQFLGWIGRFVDQAQPLADLFTEFAEQLRAYYREIADVLEGLGLFSSKTDTVKMALEALKFVLTLLLIPLKLQLQLCRAVVDVFIDWYNKSELLRGVLGGLGAYIKSMFYSLKDDAIKALGGIADLLVGIFTLDRAKIAAGLKAALSVTADLAFDNGHKAAEAFAKGYEASKNNRITKTVRVKVEEEGSATPAGEKLKSDDSADDAAAKKKAEAAAKKAKADRDRADREHLADLKLWVKDEGDILDTRNLLTEARQAAADTVELQHREAQRQKILDEANRKYNALATMEGNHTAEMQAVIEERDQKLRELQAGFDEKDKQEKERKLSEQLGQMEAEEALAVEQLENKRANELLSEGEYQAQLYDLQQQALEKRLKLLEQFGESESEKAKKLRSALLKGETEHVTAVKKMDADYLKFKQASTREGMALLSEGLSYLVENLDKQSAAYQFFKAAMKTLQLAEIGLNLEGELSANALNAAKDVRNGLPGGSAIVATELAIKDGLAIGRAAFSAIKVAAFAQGGRTDRRAPEPVMLDQLGALYTKQTGNTFALGGPVQQATLGLIGEAGPELVIPNWLYADPRQANLMGFLEATIASRGNAFAAGGSTTGSSPVMSSAGPGADFGQLVGLVGQLVQSHQEFRDEISDWQRELAVSLDLPHLKKQLDVVGQVTTGGGIRS